MPDGLIEAAAKMLGGADDHVHGVAVGEVIDNLDPMNEGRVKLKLPWLPGFEPWARVAATAAGSRRGLYWIPQTGDEVLVAFEQGDVRDPYVLGVLWNGRDLPPSDDSSDAISKVILKTPNGHRVELDDLEQSVTIETISGQTVTIDPDQIELEAGGAKATFETSGKIEISGGPEISLTATKIKLDATTIEVQAGASAKLDGGGSCTITGGVVRIN